MDQWARRQRKCGGADDLAKGGLGRFISNPDPRSQSAVRSKAAGTDTLTSSRVRFYKDERLPSLHVSFLSYGARQLFLDY
jgi:hypothetical protein